MFTDVFLFSFFCNLSQWRTERKSNPKRLVRGPRAGPMSVGRRLWSASERRKSTFKWDGSSFFPLGFLFYCLSGNLYKGDLFPRIVLKPHRELGSESRWKVVRRRYETKVHHTRTLPSSIFCGEDKVDSGRDIMCWLPGAMGTVGCFCGFCAMDPR